MNTTEQINVECELIHFLAVLLSLFMFDVSNSKINLKYSTLNNIQRYVSFDKYIAILDYDF